MNITSIILLWTDECVETLETLLNCLEQIKFYKEKKILSMATHNHH